MAKRVLIDTETLHAPHLLDLEVIQVLRRFWLNGEIDARRAEEAHEDFVSLPIRRYPHTFMLPRIWELRHNLTAYDAAYIALAEALDAPLLTRDAGLAGTRSVRARIELI